MSEHGSARGTGCMVGQGPSSLMMAPPLWGAVTGRGHSPCKQQCQFLRGKLHGDLQIPYVVPALDPSSHSLAAGHGAEQGRSVQGSCLWAWSELGRLQPLAKLPRGGCSTAAHLLKQELT